MKMPYSKQILHPLHGKKWSQKTVLKCYRIFSFLYFNIICLYDLTQDGLGAYKQLTSWSFLISNTYFCATLYYSYQKSQLTEVQARRLSILYQIALGLVFLVCTFYWVILHEPGHYDNNTSLSIRGMAMHLYGPLLVWCEMFINSIRIKFKDIKYTLYIALAYGIFNIVYTL